MCARLKCVYAKTLTDIIKNLDAIEKEVHAEIALIDDEFIKKLMVNHYIDGLTWERIALELGFSYSAANVRQLVSRYRKEHRK